MEQNRLLYSIDGGKSPQRNYVSNPHVVIHDGEQIQTKSSTINEFIKITLHDLYESSSARHNNNRSGGETMDEATKMMLGQLKDDMRDHKQEIRDRDARIQSDVAEREARIHKEAEEREERILAAIKESNQSLKAEMQEIKSSVGRSEQRLDETAKHVHSMVAQNFWGRLAALVAILAICATVWVTVWSSYQ